tara:strand:- start:170 stop:277 length:108 start_codon:yes stop_codon:yes gene_type:complete
VRSTLFGGTPVHYGGNYVSSASVLGSASTSAALYG